MSQKNRNRLLVLLIVALPILIFAGFLISEIIKPTPVSLISPNSVTNPVQSPR
ncbi:MAG TPA: hypothetical protein VGO57_03875 [Verrucomicrobiae bacterium]|jgi:hypothetical protein